MPFQKGVVYNPAGRPKRVHEKRSLAILREVINDNRQKELAVLMYMGARGWRPVYSDDGKVKFEPDPRSSPASRATYINMIWDRLMGKPLSNITIDTEPPSGEAFDDWVRSLEPEKFAEIVEEANKILKGE